MENEIDNGYIENAINELEENFGIKEDICSEKLFSLVRTGKIKESVEIIARQIGLPIKINIIKVPNNYKAQNDDNKFHGTYLVKTDQHGSGIDGITAQVIIPGDLPFYGSSGLNGYPIDVKISENCINCPVVFSMIMAHELSHVLLRSLCHPKKDNEFYTDLIAMILGFKTIFQNGRRMITTEGEFDLMSRAVKTTTTTYGYLSDSQSAFAMGKIATILKKNKERKEELFKSIKLFKKTLLKYKAIIFIWRKGVRNLLL